MADVWGQEGTIPQPFAHLMAHLALTRGRLQSALDGNLPVLDHERGELDAAVNRSVGPSAEAALRTLTELADMPTMDDDRVGHLRDNYDRQEEANIQQATQGGGNGPG